MKADWIAVDWGTTRLRAWAMGPDGVRAEAASDEGMGRLDRAGFEPALLRLIGGWLGSGVTPVLACGMVGSRQGWHEVPYRQVPCAPVAAGALAAVPVQDRRIAVQIVPGLAQSVPADVMRGEETQIAGALTLHPGFDGAVCLPGTHSKWAQVSAGEVVSFQTFLTGELFALLSEQSVLRHGLSEGWDDSAFDAGLAEGASRPERLMALLFRLRAEGLLSGLSGAAARSRLSGLLIGAELAAARPWWLGLPILLIGADRLCGLYARGLAAQGATARVLPATDCTLAGLALASGALKGAAA
ncbi:2-dehydro-3-deoxygalactonokinase [Pseudogemmobacter blasticus]|uniref:2-keto-3-deoxy-galactonokinase n=1 Tax=Fuscovulum blasticum DSM 2131 TaxID=1188250 RepID=A0A2T4J5X3_FUSBL|nr:2-dehydro-3-deoxygalactonokinase [Fuscovulum blasticum]PTE13253.1 2-keto-3-deoxy-galactonokinase [Fuscovulum blasticum DSM 2131]